MNLTFTLPDTEIELENVNAETLAFYWWLAQRNPAGIENREAGELAERVGREIIRRWMADQAPPLWHHQGRHYFWDILCKNGSWLPVNGDDKNREWVYDHEKPEQKGGAS